MPTQASAATHLGKRLLVRHHDRTLRPDQLVGIHGGLAGGLVCAVKLNLADEGARVRGREQRRPQKEGQQDRLGLLSSTTVHDNLLLSRVARIPPDLFKPGPTVGPDATA